MIKKRNLYQKMRPPNLTTFFLFCRSPFFVHFSKKKHSDTTVNSSLSTGFASNSKLFIYREHRYMYRTGRQIKPEWKKKDFVFLLLTVVFWDFFLFQPQILLFSLSSELRWPQCKWPQQQKSTTTSSKKQWFPVKTKTYALIYTIWIFWRKFRRSEVQFKNPKFDFKKKSHPCRKQFTQKFSQQFSKFNPKIQLLEFTQITSCSIHPSVFLSLSLLLFILMYLPVEPPFRFFKAISVLRVLMVWS